MNRIELRPFTKEEYHTFFKGYKPDAEVDPSPFVYDPVQIEKSYEYNHGGSRENYEHLGIFLDGIPVGSFQLKRIDTAGRKCEFGLILRDEQVRNRGVGSEAIRLGMEMAKEKYGILHLWGDTMGRNKRMQRVFGKLGFRVVSIIVDDFSLYDGSLEDRLVYVKDLGEETGK